MNLRKMLRALFRPRPPPPPPRPADPRLEQDPWLGEMFGLLGDRYQLGPEQQEGTRVLRRTGRARFNPMAVWLKPAERLVRGDYEVRGQGAAETVAREARQLLDERISAPLASLGLASASDAVEEWGGVVLVRTYEGRCDEAERAANAVRYLCERSEQQINLAAE